MNSELIIPILASSVIASLLTAIFSKFNNDKNILIENVVKERKTWRDKIRSLVLEAENGFQKKDENRINCILAQLTVLLNPMDKKDIEILESLKKTKISWDRINIEEFYNKVSLLLKHDWERVKKETKTNVSAQTLLLAFIYSVTYIFIVKEYLLTDPSVIKYSILIMGLLILPIINDIAFTIIKNILTRLNLNKANKIIHLIENKAFRN